jgi:predicted nicotinamide N-methyase
VLAAYLAQQPAYRYLGTRAVELGAGPGLVGLLLAALGSHVTITDLAACIPLIEDNIALNGLGGIKRDGRGHAEAAVLEWGRPGDEAAAAALAAEPLDLVVAADCVYVNGVRRACARPLAIAGPPPAAAGPLSILPPRPRSAGLPWS